MTSGGKKRKSNIGRKSTLGTNGLKQRLTEENLSTQYYQNSGSFEAHATNVCNIFRSNLERTTEVTISHKRTKT